MPKEPRGAVISIRLSENEQAHLRSLAADQGKSVSEVVREFVTSSIGPELPQGITASSAQTGTGSFDRGMFWATDTGIIAGSTITICAAD